MKDIYEILTGLGLEIPADRKADFEKELFSNYKSIAEFEKKESKIVALTEQLNTATEGLEAFKDVDVKDLQAQIAKLTGDLTAKDSEYQAKLDEMEFDQLLSGVVSEAKGRNAKAIKALLDLDSLKASKNQEADIKAALEQLKKENTYLFEDNQTPPPYAAGTGAHPLSAKYTPEENAIRAAAGLKTE